MSGTLFSHLCAMFDSLQALYFTYTINKQHAPLIVSIRSPITISISVVSLGAL